MNNGCGVVVAISCERCNSSAPIRAGNLSSGLCLMHEADENPRLTGSGFLKPDIRMIISSVGNMTAD